MVAPPRRPGFYSRGTWEKKRGPRRSNLESLRTLLLLLLLAACRVTEKPPTGLAAVRTWAIQLDGIELDGAADALVAADLDMVVIEPTRTIRGQEWFETAALVARLKGSGKLCLAYVNVGQAESYRTYWRHSWKAPAEGRPGFPSFIVTIDPEGWAGNYPVAYWDLRWKAVLWGAKAALVDQAIADGFDGVYLDWVLGFEEPAVARLSDDPEGEMIKLLRDLRLYARRRRPGFLVIAQNGAELPGLGGVVDGYAQEPLRFAGKAGAEWDDPQAGGVPLGGLAARIERLKRLKVPVFTVDYAVDPDQAEVARETSRALGFRPFVSRVPLDRLP